MNNGSPAIFLVIIFCAFNTFSQVKAMPMTESNLYARALNACIAKEAEAYGKPGTNRADYENLIVESNIYLTDKLPKQFGQTKIEYLNANELRQRFEKTREKIPVLSLRPIINEGTTLVISIGNYWFSYKKKSYAYALEVGCTVRFNFDGRQQSIALTKIDFWGI